MKETTKRGNDENPPYFPISHCRSFYEMDKTEASKVKLDQLKGTGWVSMYPSYLDKSMSVKDGRRVTTEFACMFNRLESVE